MTGSDARLAPEVLLLMEVSESLVALALRSLGAAEGKVNLQQFRALRLLEERGPCNAGGVAAALDLHPSSVTRLVDRLVAAGYVTRDVKAHNRREVEVDVTRDGRRIVAAVLGRRTQELQAVVGAMGDEAAARLRDVLPALLAAQRAEDDGQPEGFRLH